jgi:hypothetical protein
MSWLSSLLGGRPAQATQYNNYTPQQQQAFASILGGGQQSLPDIFSYLQKIMSQDPEMMKQFEDPMRRDFEQNTLPSISERFTSTFGPGAGRSSGFGQAMGQAATNFQQDLASQRAQLGGQASQQLMQLMNMGLTPQFDTAITPRRPGLIEQGLNAGISSLPYLFM